MPARPDLERTALTDEAMFATARVAAARRSWLPGATLVLVVVVLVGSAILVNVPEGKDLPQAAIAPSPVASAASAPATAKPRRTAGPAIGEPAQLVQLEARPNGRYVFVNGDVFSMAAIDVVVSLEADATVMATRTIRLPGGSTSFLTGGNPRFQVQFKAPAATGAMWVTAVARDASGEVVASVRQAVLTRLVFAPTSAVR